MPKLVPEDKKRVPLNCLVTPATMAWLREFDGSQGEGVDTAVAAIQSVDRMPPAIAERFERISARFGRKQKVAEELAASDLTAQVVERDDIDYGHHESLPRGEHVANLKSFKPLLKPKEKR